MQEVVGSNPSTGYWRDIFSHIFFVKLYCLFEKTANKRKEAGYGPFKKDCILGRPIQSLYRLEMKGGEQTCEQKL